MPGNTTLYHEREIAVDLDPLQTVARLTTDGAFAQHVLYERGGEYCLAGGVLAELRVSASRALMTIGEHTPALVVPPAPLEAIAHFTAALPSAAWRIYGWAAFELSHVLAGVDPADTQTDLLHLIVPRAEVRLLRDRVVLRAVDEPLLARLAALMAARAPAQTAQDPETAVSPTRVRISVEDTGNFRAAVTCAVMQIRAKALEKVILSRAVAVPEPIDLVATYVAGRRANTPARSFLLRLGRMRAAGFSPETVVEVSPDGRVLAQPLAGTRARTACPDSDALLRADLLADPKEIYEHAVSVRAVWDELASLDGLADIHIEQYMAVRERGSVQHLASTLVGQLPQGDATGPWRAFATLFPSITATGIPKQAAYRVIRELEPRERGLYAGAVLICDQSGELDAALVLRSIYQDAERTWIQAGAGIVHQSNPEREHEETCEKLRSVSEHLISPALAPETADGCPAPTDRTILDTSQAGEVPAGVRTPDDSQLVPA
jgi:salicylate synthetase